VRHWLEAVKSDEYGSQPYTYLQQKIDSLPNAYERDTEAAVAYWQTSKKEKSKAYFLAYRAAKEARTHFDNAYGVWVGDFNGDGSQDIAFTAGEGSANCVSGGFLISAQAAKKYFNLADLVDADKQSMDLCSGAGGLGGMVPVTWGGSKYWLVYSMSNSKGLIRLLRFNSSGAMSFVEKVQFQLPTQRYVQSHDDAGKLHCELDICQKALGHFQLDLKEIFGSLGVKDPAKTTLEQAFLETYENKGLAAKTDAHPWGSYSEYDVHLREFRYDGQQYVVKIAPMGIGWREWCCGMSIYAPDDASFKPVAHMFIIPVKHVVISKD